MVIDKSDEYLFLQIKILTALGACHMTVIGEVVDESSASALINLGIRLNVPILNVCHFQALSLEIPRVHIQNNCETEKTC